MNEQDKEDLAQLWRPNEQDKEDLAQLWRSFGGRTVRCAANRLVAHGLVCPHKCDDKPCLKDEYSDDSGGS